jgi:aryl-alcohol dehydrogenase-like predicted oxidoreductase
MRTVVLGASKLEVTPIAYGTWQFGGDWGPVDDRNAIAAIQGARALGINFFDTAQGYGFGASEVMLGKALRKEITADRDSVVIATKGGILPGGQGRDASAAYLRKGVEESLRALDVETIDLYQVHWPDAKVPAAETAGALQELVDAGKIRYVGVSNYDSRQMATFQGVRPIDALQPPYHLFRRDIERTILPFAAEHGIGVMVYGPLGHGLLSGRMTADTRFAPDDWRSKSEAFSGEAFRRNLSIVNDLRQFAAERGATVAQLAIAWTLANPAVDVAIVGARSADQIRETAPAADLALPPDDLARIDEILRGEVPVGGPAPEKM